MYVLNRSEQSGKHHRDHIEQFDPSLLRTFRVIEGENTHDQIAFCAFHSLSVEEENVLDSCCMHTIHA